MTAARIEAPVLSCRTRVLGGVTFSWPAVAHATGYTFYLTASSPGTYTTDTSEDVVSLVGSGIATVVAHRAFGATTWTSEASNGVAWSSLVVSGCG